MEVRERTMEQALGKAEADADAALQAAATVTRWLRRVRNAAKNGDTKALRANLDGAQSSLKRLDEQVANSKEGWDFDDEAYIESGLYLRELLEAAQKAGLSVHESEGRLFSYPSVVRPSSKDRALYINKKRAPNLRPNVVVARLKREQQNPPGFRPQAYLEALYRAYEKLVAARGLPRDAQPDLLLLDVYDLFTLLPGQANEYSKQDFVRDVYRLHVSGVNETKDGAHVEFHASTVTKNQSKRLTIVTETGEVRFYATIRFVAVR